MFKPISAHGRDNIIHLMCGCEYTLYMNVHSEPTCETSNQVWRDSTKTKTPTSPFQIGESLRYTNKEHTEMLDLVDINTNDPDRNNCRIKLFIRNTIIVTN